MIDARTRFPFELHEWVPTDRALKRGPPYWLFHDFRKVFHERCLTLEAAERSLSAYRALGKSMTITRVAPDGTQTGLHVYRGRDRESSDGQTKEEDHQEDQSSKEGQDPQGSSSRP